MANTLSQFENVIKNNKNIHQKVGLTAVRHSCRLKEKRERHELIRPHGKVGPAALRGAQPAAPRLAPAGARQTRRLGESSALPLPERLRPAGGEPATAGRAEVPVVSLEKNKSQHVGLSSASASGRARPHIHLISEGCSGAQSQGGRRRANRPFSASGSPVAVPGASAALGTTHPTWCLHPGTRLLVPPPQARAPGWPTTSPAMPGVGGGARQAAGQVAKEGEEGAWKSVRPEGRRAGSARGQGHVLQPGLEGSLR